MFHRCCFIIESISEVVGDELYLLCFIGCLAIHLIVLYILVESLRDCSISLFNVIFRSASHLLVVDVFELE